MVFCFRVLTGHCKVVDLVRSAEQAENEDENNKAGVEGADELSGDSRRAVFVSLRKDLALVRTANASGYLDFVETCQNPSCTSFEVRNGSRIVIDGVPVCNTCSQCLPLRSVPAAT